MSGMIVGSAVGAADGVGQSALGAHVLKETRAEAAAEDFVHDREGVVVGVAAFGPESDDADIALVHIALLDEVDARLRAREILLWLPDDRRALRQAIEGGAQGLLHGCRVEVAADADDHVVGDDGAFMPGLQIGDGYRHDGRDLRLACVGAGGPIDEARGFAAGDPGGAVVAADDAGGHLLLGQLELFFVEGGMLEKIEDDRRRPGLRPA